MPVYWQDITYLLRKGNNESLYNNYLQHRCELYPVTGSARVHPVGLALWSAVVRRRWVWWAAQSTASDISHRGEIINASLAFHFPEALANLHIAGGITYLLQYCFILYYVNFTTGINQRAVQQWKLLRPILPHPLSVFTILSNIDYISKVFKKLLMRLQEKILGMGCSLIYTF